MLSEKKIACMYRGISALRKLQTHRKCKRRMRKKVGADLGADASEMPHTHIYVYIYTYIYIKGADHGADPKNSTRTQSNNDIDIR